MTLPLSYSRPPIQEAHYLYFSKPAQHKCGGGRIRTCVDPKVDGFTARCHWPLDHPSIRGRLGTGTGGRFLISLSFSWREESNPQPTDYKSVALPLSYASARPSCHHLGKLRPDHEPPSLIDLPVGSTHHQLAKAVAQMCHKPCDRKKRGI